LPHLVFGRARREKESRIARVAQFKLDHQPELTGAAAGPETLAVSL